MSDGQAVSSVRHSARAGASAEQVAQAPVAPAESSDPAKASAASMVAGMSAFLRASGQALAPAGGAVPAPEAASATNAMLTDQVVSAFLSHRADNSQHMTIRLDPPELGVIRLSIQADKDSVLRGVVHVDNPETFKQIQRETPQLIERLMEGGIQVKQIDVQMSTSGGGGQSSWQSQGAAGGWDQQGGGGGQAPSPQGAAGPVVESAPETSAPAVGAGVFSGHSVNLWL